MCHLSLGELAELEEILLEGYSMNISAVSYEPFKLFKSIHNLYVFGFNQNLRKGLMFDQLISEDLKKIRLPPLYQKERQYLSAVRLTLLSFHSECFQWEIVGFLGWIKEI